MKNRTTAGALALLVLLGSLTTSAPPARADGYVTVTGSGSTWSQNALDQWRTNVSRNYGMTINYTGSGSSSGRKEFRDGGVDFAISEIPFQAQPTDGSMVEIDNGVLTGDSPVKFAYLPIVAGGTSFMYNLKINGKRVTNLRLSGETITKIFTGQITKWNDPALLADNPGLQLPNRSIVPVGRSDGSGTTAQFTLWMSRQHSNIWKHGMTSQFPAGGNTKLQKGSDGVSGYVAQNYGEGAITYVEYSYAKKSGFPIAKVLNKAGYYVESTAYSVAVALTAAKINPDLTQNLDGVYNHADKRAYPLSSYSYAIVPTEITTKRSIFDVKKGATLAAFLRYVLCEGQQQADTLGYSPLPVNLVEAGSKQISKIPGAGGKGVDIGKCHNPTVDPGGKDKNRLARIAPMPQECDRLGITQCATGTGGAQQETIVRPPVGNKPGNGSNAKPGSPLAPGAQQPGQVNPNGQPGGNGGNGPGVGPKGQPLPNGQAPGTKAGTGKGTTATNAGNPAAVDPNNPAAVNPGAIPVTDEEGNIISGGDGAGVLTDAGGAAVATPFTMPAEGMGADQWLVVGAAGLLLGAIVVPPLMSRRLRTGALDANL